jgi:TolA-binding protein
MGRIVVVALFCCVFALSACSGKGAQELFETAQFEEKQNNLDHARKLYEEIIAKHPQSDLAAKAKERLDAMPAK